MTVDDTFNEYTEMANKQRGWSSSEERSRVYLAHCINQLTGAFILIAKEMREQNKKGK